MSVPILTFFNNKGGVGKTSLIYHLSWMFAELGHRIIAIDLDPQANLTAAFLEEDKLEELWGDDSESNTIFKCLEPLTQVGDFREPVLSKIEENLKEPVHSKIEDNLYLVPGDLALAGFEDILSNVWPESMGDNNLFRPFRVLTAFWQIAQRAAEIIQAELILADVGPNLGAINRSALIASNYVAIPLGADLFSLQGLKNLGPTLRAWRSLWKKRLDNWKNPQFSLPAGNMLALGYLVQQYGVRLSRPVQAYDKWVKRMPGVYRKYILNKSEEIESGMLPTNDPYCLATVKHYRSLIPMAQEVRKPVFKLTQADGAIGGHAAAVHEAYDDFKKLAMIILKKMRESTSNQ